MTQPIQIFDPVPVFEGQTLAGTSHGLEVLAGRWIVLAFVEDLNDPRVTETFAEIIAALGRFFNDDHVVFYAILTSAPADSGPFAVASHRGLGFIMDYDHKITDLYRARGNPSILIIDPLLRAAQSFAIGQDGTPAHTIISALRSLPPVDEHAGVPLSAPALIIPRIFERDFCQTLIALYEKNGGQESGFLIDHDGKTKTVVDHAQKQRQDFHIEDPATRAAIRDRVVRRVLPSMERFFQYRPTRMDRYLVSCYGADGGGHFARHRDNVNAGARHRRFAASFNLNDGYNGCDLMFPEFGRRLYRAPVGGAIVFATGALHQVMPITTGKRYAFVPFFYGEEEVEQRISNNSALHAGEALYDGSRDKLFP